MSDFESMHDLVGAYALDAIDESERAAFEGHLNDCAQCREELASFGSVLDALSDDVADGSSDSVQAPAGLADRIGAQIALTPQVSIDPTSDGNTADMPRVEADIMTAGAEPIDDATESSNVVPFARPGGAADDAATGSTPGARRSRLTMMLASAAAAVAVAAVGIGFLVSNGSPDANLAAVDSVLEASDARRIDLGVGDAQITVSAEAGGFAATGTAPALATGEEYQLWLVNADGTIDPGPTFEDGEFQTAVIADLSGVQAIAVSVEPGGGSEQPTTDPIAVVDV